MNCKAIAIALAIVMYISSARAWDDEGHMIVAAIAWKNLDAASRARLATAQTQSRLREMDC
jgi:hypothetical protein